MEDRFKLSQREYDRVFDTLKRMVTRKRSGEVVNHRNKIINADIQSMIRSNALYLYGQLGGKHKTLVMHKGGYYIELNQIIHSFIDKLIDANSKKDDDLPF